MPSASDRDDRRPPARKPRPAWLRAMGSGEPPTSVRVDGQRWISPVPLKHDAFAATARYRHAQDPHRQVIVKFARTSPAFGLPMRWLGKWSIRKELRVHARLADLPGIPTCYPRVADEHGRVIRNAWARQFIAATPLDQWPTHTPVPDAFFPSLWQRVADAHARRVAFVDLNKPDNLLIMPEGDATIIDFQISTALPDAFILDNPLSRAWLRLLQDCDRYHLMKHWSRRRPDQLTEDQHDLDRYRPRVIRLWRRGWRPVILLRRRLLVLLKVRHGPGTADTETATLAHGNPGNPAKIAAIPAHTTPPHADAERSEASGLPATP